MLTIAVASIVVGETTIYRSQLETRADAPGAPEPGIPPALS
jgi:hypothetical protein